MRRIGQFLKLFKDRSRQVDNQLRWVWHCHLVRSPPTLFSHDCTCAEDFERLEMAWGDSADLATPPRVSFGRAVACDVQDPAEEVRNFVSTLFGPLLAFILGYYFASHEDS